MRLLVLGSCAGIGSDGFAQAGWDVHGVDIDPRPQRHDPHPHSTGDMLEVLQDRAFLSGFDAISAHPPCQGYSALRCLADAQGKGRGRAVDLIGPVRRLLQASGLPWVIENVPRSPLATPVTTCGSAFGLGVRRHRWWESEDFWLLPTVCDHKTQGRPWGVFGSRGDNIPSGGRTVLTIEQGHDVMGVERRVPWTYLCEAIPPAYTRWIGTQMWEQLAARRAA